MIQKLLILGVLLLAGVRCFGQVEDSATAGSVPLSVGGSFQLLRRELWVDQDRWSWQRLSIILRLLAGNLGVEGEGRWLMIGGAHSFSEYNYLVGPRYRFYYKSEKYQPYAKFLVGAGEINFPYDLAHGGYFVLAPGGGIDIVSEGALEGSGRLRVSVLAWRPWNSRHSDRLISSQWRKRRIYLQTIQVSISVSAAVKLDIVHFNQGMQHFAITNTIDAADERFSPDQVKASVARSLLATLESECKSYCILSGYDRLPESFDTDIDFMVDADDFARMPQIIEKVAHDTNTKLFHTVEHELSAQIIYSRISIRRRNR